MKRFIKCLRLNVRQIVKKQFLLFLILLGLLAMLFYGVQQSISFSMTHYDYVDRFFDRTQENYYGLVLNSRYNSYACSFQLYRPLWQELYDVCGAVPLSPTTYWSSDNLESFTYPQEVLDIVPAMREGRWLTAEDALLHNCVVSTAAAQQHPIGSVITENFGEGVAVDYVEFHVVGVLDEGEKPFESGATYDPYCLSSFVQLDREDAAAFAVIPVEASRFKKLGTSMWFRTDKPFEEMQELLKPYGTLFTMEQLVSIYKHDCIKGIFSSSPIYVILLAVSLIATVSVMVINFGRNRRQYAVMYLLGQSGGMLMACAMVIYIGTVLAAFGLAALYVLLTATVSVSVAWWIAAGVAALAMLILSAVVWAFFRKSPMQLFTDSK